VGAGVPVARVRVAMGVGQAGGVGPEQLERLPRQWVDGHVYLPAGHPPAEKMPAGIRGRLAGVIVISGVSVVADPVVRALASHAGPVHVSSFSISVVAAGVWAAHPRPFVVVVVAPVC